MTASPSRALLLLLLLLLAASSADGRGTSTRPAPLSVGDPAFASRLESVDGKSVLDLVDTGGRPLAVVFGSYT